MKFWREKRINDYAVQFLTKLLEIYSPSGKEGEIGAFIADEMKELGFKVKVDAVGNVIGEVGVGKPEILLCGHMDTVPGYIPVRAVDGKLYGRGAVDAKSSLATMVLAANSVAERFSSGKILVAGVVEEEKTGKGMKHLIKEGLSADYAVFGEPSGVENIVIGYKGSLRLKLACETQAGHSAAPWLFENAIEKTFEVWKVIRETRFPNEDLNSHFYSVTSCLIRLRGGESAASNVPSKCEALIDVRVPPQLTCAQVYEEIKGKVAQYQAANPKVTVNIKVVDSVEAFETDKGNPLVKALSSAVRKVRGKTPVLVRKTGTSDMNLLSRALKIPVVAYGPGDSSLDHTPSEWVSVEEYLDSIRVLQEGLTKLLC
ncbi:MAG: M20/M25/M40 family metallo-hydrolase [Candidatus Bathyarchaeia archaeon]